MDSLEPDPPDLPAIAIPGSKRRAENDVNASSAKKTIVNKETASASIQTMYLHPSLVVGIKEYTSLDKGPFVVHVSRTEPEPAAGTAIRPIQFGQFLFKNKISNICTDGVKKVGRNKISVEFSSAVAANKFLDNPLLEKHAYQVTIPSYNITKMGIVRQVPVELAMEEFVESLSLPSSCGNVLKARRLNRKTVVEGKVTWVPTQTVVITFQGQVLPQRIYLFHTSLPVETYQFPTIQCQNCCRFGHVKMQCRSKPRCFRCAQPHAGDSCEVIESKATCLHCSGQHFASNKGCPEQGRQKTIKLLMSQDNISYEDASHRFPKPTRPYAEVIQDSNSNLPQSHPSLQRTQPSFYPATSSYRKTISPAPRLRAPLGSSFDRSAHQAIVADSPSALPNGHALSLANSLPSSQDDSLLEILLTMIISIISKNNSSLPSHVAHKLSQIISLSNNYGSSLRATVEHEKP